MSSLTLVQCAVVSISIAENDNIESMYQQSITAATCKVFHLHASIDLISVTTAVRSVYD